MKIQYHRRTGRAKRGAGMENQVGKPVNELSDVPNVIYPNIAPSSFVNNYDGSLLTTTTIISQCHS